VDKQHFTELFDHLYTGLGSRPVSGQADVWFQIINGRMFSYSVVAKAVETLIATAKKSRPLPADLIAECSKIQVQITENDRAKEKEIEDGPFRAKLADGTPISRIASKVVAALKGDEEAQKELNW